MPQVEISVGVMFNGSFDWHELNLEASNDLTHVTIALRAKTGKQNACFRYRDGDVILEDSTKVSALPGSINATAVVSDFVSYILY